MAKVGTEDKQALRLLLVDDEQDILDILGILFAMDGAEVFCAHSYNEALEVLESRTIDIVVTDYSMPRMHGLYLLDMIKDQYPDMPVILMTAYLTDDVAVEARRRKSDLILTKPFEYSEMLEGIRKLMKKKWRK